MCEINVGFYFFPFFVHNAFSIVTALFQFGHFPLARCIYGVWVSLVCAFFFFLLQALVSFLM